MDVRCFELISIEKSYLLQAENEEQMNEWVSVLQNVIAKELNSQTPFNSDPSETEKSENALQVLQRANKDNCSCADCGAPGNSAVVTMATH
jgi:hypothetical protein